MRHAQLEPASSRLRSLRLALLACGACPAHALLPIQHWQTTSGARVYFVENRDLPMLDVSVDFPPARLRHAREVRRREHDQPLLQLGADGMSEDEIARRLADVGAQLGGRFGTDRAGLSCARSRARRSASQALDIFARILRRPEFPRRCWSARRCG